MKPSSYQESRLLSLLFLWAVDSKVRFRAELFAEQAGWWPCWVAIHMILWYRVVAGEEFSTGRPESITEEGIRYGGNCLASVSLLAQGIGFKILWRETASRSQNIWYRTGDILGTKRASSEVMNWDRIGVTAIFHHTQAHHQNHVLLPHTQGTLSSLPARMASNHLRPHCTQSQGEAAVEPVRTSTRKQRTWANLFQSACVQVLTPWGLSELGEALKGTINL